LALPEERLNKVGAIVRGLKSALGADATRHEWRLPSVFKDASPQAPSGGFQPPNQRRLVQAFLSER
jgi:hypothetical protein